MVIKYFKKKTDKVRTKNLWLRHSRPDRESSSLFSNPAKDGAGMDSRFRGNDVNG